MIISEKNTKVVFLTLVCISLGALLGIEVNSRENHIETYEPVEVEDLSHSHISQREETNF